MIIEIILFILFILLSIFFSFVPYDIQIIIFLNIFKLTPYSKFGFLILGIILFILAVIMYNHEYLLKIKIQD